MEARQLRLPGFIVWARTPAALRRPTLSLGRTFRRWRPSLLDMLLHLARDAADWRFVLRHAYLLSSAAAFAVPVSALFRKGEDWAVFTVRDGRARTTVVQFGHRNNRQAEVLSGLSPGDVVVLHPTDRVRDGERVAPRG